MVATAAAVAEEQVAAPAAAPSSVEILREHILHGMVLRPGMRVAEIGFGRGWFVFRAAEAVGAHGVVYATDIDPEAIAALRPELAHMNPAAGRVELRLVRDPRDTGLDDLPDNDLDVISMIDSLCFDTHEPAEHNVEYLHRLLRLLRPRGRLVHHMDCRCEVDPDTVAAQFVAAGFSPVERMAPPPAGATADPTSPCVTAAAVRRHDFIGVFRKPRSRLGDGALTVAMRPRRTDRSRTQSYGRIPRRRRRAGLTH
jgi:SAM-dependent methyltransferase